MEMKHTPGPWEVVPKTGGAIVTVSGVSVGMANRSSFAVGERMANARLMAAAPEMLGALLLWREYCDMQVYGHDDAEYQSFVSALNATHAAVAAAIGE